MNRMPAIFVGHGSPMLALDAGKLSQGLAQAGRKVIEKCGRPRAILAVSAHWYTRGTFTQDRPDPRQLYDMQGFPPELYEVAYPVEGCPELGDEVVGIAGLDAQIDNGWGIDHGVWTPLVHMFPEADVPVVELSVNREFDTEDAYGAGQRLASLRDEGYLVLGSGNVVHNLRKVDWDSDTGSFKTRSFDAYIREAVENRRDRVVIDYKKADSARYAVPTPEHFLPLLYVLGASRGERPLVFNAECTLDAVSMTSYAFGLDGE